MSSSFQIEAGYILPHPPIIVPGVSKGPHKANQTVEAFEKAAADFASCKVQTVVVISPHAPLFRDFVFFYDDSELAGDLGRFGAPQSRVSHKIDRAFQSDLVDRLTKAGYDGGGLTPDKMRQYQIDRALDHGVVVPLWFLDQANPDCRLVAMSCSGLPIQDIYRIGELIRQSAASLDRRTVIVASGDQSHRVNANSPYGVRPEGGQYDQDLVRLLKEGNVQDILSMDEQVRERAGECGYRSVVMLLGAMNRQVIKSHVGSYEAPYGIGYCVADLRPDPEQDEPIPDAFIASRQSRRSEIEKMRASSSAPVAIARDALEANVRGETNKTMQDFADLPGAADLIKNRAGVFVSIKKHGELRGCIGTTRPTAQTLIDEIIRNAVSAGTRDPRFSAVSADELPDLVYSVDVLGAPEPIELPDQLNVRRYGVIVSHGGRSGLLLPDLDGVDTVQDQLAIACQKAGISPDDPYQISRFTVTRYH